MSREDLKNSEGYYDLTAYEAIKNIEGYNSSFNTGSLSIDAKRSYIKKKLKILIEEFLVTPTYDEILDLFKLPDESQIDKAVIGIIVSHWDKE